MKILAALVALPMAALPMQCDPAPPPNPPGYQTTGRGITMEASAACAVFSATLYNTSGRPSPAIWSFYVDGSLYQQEYVHSDHVGTVRIYLPNDSGDHTVAVRWAGEPSTYRVWTDCAP